MRKMIVLFALVNVVAVGAFGQKTVYIRRDKFVSEAFGFPVSVENFKKRYGKFLIMAKDAMRYDYDSSRIDTIYSFTKGRTNIKIYHDAEKDFLLSAFIDTDKIPLKYNIKVGDTRVSVAKLLKTKITGNKIKVGDLEQGQVYTFTFAKNKLVSISYEGYVD